jgi:hypothetical protein
MEGGSQPTLHYGDFFVGAMKGHYEAASKVRKANQPGKRGIKDKSLDALEAGLLDERKDKEGKTVNGPFTNIVKQLRRSWIKKRNDLAQKGSVLIRGPLAKIQLSYEHLGSEQKSDNSAKQMRAELERAV